MEAAKGQLAAIIVALQDFGYYPPDPAKIEAMGPAGKELEAKWESNSKFMMFFVTFMAITTVFGKFLPKEGKEVVNVRDQKKENAVKPNQNKRDLTKKASSSNEGNAEVVGSCEGEGEQQQEEPPRSVNKVPYLIIVLVLIQLHADSISQFLGMSVGKSTVVFSTSKDEPLWGKTEYYIPGQRLKEMQDSLRQHKLSRTSAGGYGSKFTEGFRVSFDLQGLQTFETEADLEHFQNFFARARISEATAWSLSVISVLPSHGSDDAGALKLRQMRTSILDLPQDHVAHQLDLLWLHVPSDLSGGHLQIFDHRRGDPSVNALTLAAPDKVLEPEENSNIHIRGDAYVQIDGFRGKASERLVLVLLEQYVLTPDKLTNAHHYVLHSKSVHEEDEEKKKRVQSLMQEAATQK
mmetsp:Transcript_38735/g.62444  ORF Transcript_38735/g.62444 Transcript_38735/m.62444 type:complete len:407 (+) Transcript_38735:35-1255(+)|eukprot:CAMPEP_0179441350 /NCGR_PEP_ID=MMETSP0799-20121207/24921_1 /TAXON_ID=46947 /ORGANISM="Geminigera cryophila, Strain CCMP2564" /LENGTH=406 /DNA_ID=CAMNT_0021225555 /DNA_START=28 /DNA_END=1248 /DNA_ORIENTATION=+